jgi:predicted N-formylglutamate amidohydrolase
MKTKLVISCEHGGNRVPFAYRALFRRHEELLRTHRGYDVGALPIARALAAELDAPLFFSRTTRLVVDLNRSLGHPALFSAITRALPAAVRQRLVARHYVPYRAALTAHVLGAAERHAVLHLSIHSFTAVLDGQTRNTDIGLLYDPKRKSERRFCMRLRQALERASPEARVRMNYPYRGTSDGMIVALRRKLSSRRYTGVEIELNQAWTSRRAGQRLALGLLSSALDEVLGRKAAPLLLAARPSGQSQPSLEK